MRFNSVRCGRRPSPHEHLVPRAEQKHKPHVTTNTNQNEFRAHLQHLDKSHYSKPLKKRSSALGRRNGRSVDRASGRPKWTRRAHTRRLSSHEGRNDIISLAYPHERLKKLQVRSAACQRMRTCHFIAYLQIVEEPLRNPLPHPLTIEAIFLPTISQTTQIYR